MMQYTKSTTAECFSKAAGQYSRFAHVQKQAAHHLFDLLPNELGCLLDLGAGPLLHGAHLSKYSNQYIACDLSEGMLQEGEGFPLKVCGDMDNLPFLSNTFDTVFSNFAIQWSSDTTSLFTDLHRVTKPDGRIFVSTILQGSLCEINQAWQSIDEHQHVNGFYDEMNLLSIVRGAGFSVAHASQEILIDEFDSPLQALKSVKNIGASVVTTEKKRAGLLGKDAFKRVLKAFPLTDGKAKVTYQVLFLELSKNA